MGPDLNRKPPTDSNVGLRLMISIYLVFWMEFAAAIRMNGPVKAVKERRLFHFFLKGTGYFSGKGKVACPS